MKIITKNNKQYYRFKIGDEFESFSSKKLFTSNNLSQTYNGDITFNAMLKKDIVSKKYSEKEGFIYPFCDSSVSNNHIKGYSKLYNFEGIGIKVSESGDAGKTKLLVGKHFVGRPAYVLVSKNFSNEYASEYLNNMIPNYKQTSVISNVMYSQIKDEYIEIPVNHEELSKVIKRILEYKQLSKQLSKQMKDYKLAILQQSEKSIKHWKETNQLDKFVTFKIGDEFKSINGKGSYNAMLKEGLCSDTYNEEQGYIYPFYDASTKNNHIKGYCKIYNNNSKGFKVSVTGNKRITNSGLLDPTPAGSTVFVEGKKYIAEKAMILENNEYTNEFTSEIFNKWLPNFSMGALNMHNCYFSYYCDEEISIPSNHSLLSSKIEQLNEWKTKVDITTQTMEKYIEGVLQFSLK